MAWYQLFQDGPEYEARKNQLAFTPPSLSLKDVHDAVPKHLFHKDTSKSLYYVFRHLFVTYAFYYLAIRIEDLVVMANRFFGMGPFLQTSMRVVLWILYGAWQGISFAGLWSLGMSVIF